jgi:hypothetical protein
MGTHYLLDLYANPLSGAKINDVNVSTDGRTTANGSFVVNIPPGVAVRDPVDLSDIITKKYQGLLVWYAGFTTLDYDDLLDASHIDLTDPQVEGRFGERGTVVINPGKRLTSVVVPLGSAPTQAVILWECFEYEDTDIKANRFVRVYHELDPDAVSDAEVSFDGTNFTSVTEGSGGVVNVPVGWEGTSFIIRITNTSSDPIHIGSWAVIY